jgi:cysteine desulfuration protein SufE
MNIENISDDFALLDSWEDRYRYIIELGRALPAFPEALRTDENKVRGCASQVWLASELDRGAAPPTLKFRGDSDAHIVRGLIAVLLSIYDGKSPQEIATTDAHAVFAGLGLKEHLTPQRSNGFAAMVERIKADARTAMTSSEPG